MPVTHYDNLQVKRNASQEVIKGAYKHLSQKWHPDKNPDNREEAGRILRIINAAYEVLSDPVRRKQHDKWIEEQEISKVFSKSSPDASSGLADTEVLRIPYRPKILATVLACIFFAVTAYVLSGVATEGGAISIGFIEISSQYSVYIYWSLVVASLVFVAIGLISIIVGITSQHHLILTGTEFSAPRHILSRNPDVIPLSSIKQCTVSGSGRNRLIIVYHQSGEISISETMILHEGAFDQFHDELTKAVSRPAG